jgi:hypothetical protein
MAIQDTTYIQVDATDPVKAFESLVAAMKANPELAAVAMGPKQGNPITLGAPVIDAAAWANKMVSRATNAGADWLAGVKAPRRNPLQAALAANQKRINAIQKSITDKTWEGAMKNVDESQMYAVIDAQGSSAFINGISTRKAKIAAKIAKLQPLISAVVTTIQNMPDATEADRVNRMTTNLTLMKKVGQQMKGAA